VVRLTGQQGGKGGEAWGLDLSRAEPALLLAFPELRRLADPDDNIDVAVETDTRAWRAQVQQDRFRIIAPVLATKPRSRARGKVLAAIIDRHQLIRGELLAVSRKTVERWLRDYEAGGIAGLMPKQTGGAGLHRVLISECWDKGIDLPEDIRITVAAKLETYVKSLFSDDMSANQICRCGAKRLAELCRDAGSSLTMGRLQAVCTFTHKFTNRFAEFRRLARRNRDNKAFFDNDLPRIRRTRASHPMEIVWGDVHPVDVYMPDGRGSTLRVRLIGWLDDCTRHLWCTVAVLGKGTGIQQKDVAASLHQMACNPNVGLAEIIYMDNGGEYGPLANALMEIPGAIPLLSQRGAVKARPYNGPGKGAVERVFATLEQGYFRHIDGWIGGDRTNKKTHAVGKPVKGFQGSIEELLNAIYAAVAAYNDAPHSSLAGLSPRQAMRQAMDNGWQAVTVDDDAFDFAFSRRDETRQIKQGGFRFANQHWTSDAVCSLGAGAEVELRVPLRSNAPGIFVVCDGKRLAGRAVPDMPYHPLDRDGAREQGRRAKLQNAAVSALKSQTDPRVDAHKEQKRFTDTSENTAEPGAIIRLADMEGDVADVETDEEKHAFIEEFLAVAGPKKRRADGGLIGVSTHRPFCEQT
jgi:hypothetical protein